MSRFTLNDGEPEETLGLHLYGIKSGGQHWLYVGCEASLLSGLRREGCEYAVLEVEYE